MSTTAIKSFIACGSAIIGSLVSSLTADNHFHLLTGLVAAGAGLASLAVVYAIPNTPKSPSSTPPAPSAPPAP